MAHRIAELDRLYTLPQAVRATGASYPTLLDWVRSGKLPAGKIGRAWVVRRDDAHRLKAESDRYYPGQQTGAAARRAKALRYATREEVTDM